MYVHYNSHCYRNNDTMHVAMHESPLVVED